MLDASDALIVPVTACLAILDIICMRTIASLLARMGIMPKLIRGSALCVTSRAKLVWADLVMRA